MNSRRDPPFTYGPQDANPRRSRGWIKWLVVLLVVLGGAGAYLYLNPEVAAPYLQGTPLELPATVTRAYKWRDADGGWRISDTPPPEGTPYEMIEVRGNVNVVPSVPEKQP